MVEKFYIKHIIYDFEKLGSVFQQQTLTFPSWGSNRVTIPSRPPRHNNRTMFNALLYMDCSGAPLW